MFCLIGFKPDARLCFALYSVIDERIEKRKAKSSSNKPQCVGSQTQNGMHVRECAVCVCQRVSSTKVEQELFEHFIFICF